APDGRVFIAEQTGTLRVVKDDKLLPAPFLTVTVDSYWERGLIGVTLDPDFPKTSHIFVLYVAAQPYPHHRLSRFTAEGDRALPGSEVILFEGDDQTKLGGTIPAGHQGGPIRFGPDGKLYVALGEQTAGKPSQSLDSLLGKILRLNPDGSIPEDNPFSNETTGKYRAIWARGLRNPFSLAFRGGTGKLFVNDVGQSSWEEINVIERGGNYGWPVNEGISTNRNFINPVHAYPPVIGRSITGGIFYNPLVAQFPSNYAGKYFFLDYMAHWLRVLDPRDSQKSSLFAKNLNGPVALDLAPDGSLYVLNRAAWVKDNRFVTNSGSLMRIRYNGTAQPIASFPKRLSQTDLFADVADLKLRPGFVSFELNAPIWLPGVSAQRWLRLPDGNRIHLGSNGDLSLPAGSVVIQHFDATGRKLETHVYWCRDSNCYRAAAYRWNSAGDDAALVEDGEVIAIGSKRHWYSPGTEECLRPETTVSGFVLQLNARQINRATLRHWNELGMLEPTLSNSDLASLEQLEPLNNERASPELRVRSWLDANCAVCHQPGGPSRGLFDARFSTPLNSQNLINGELVAGDLGVAGARVIVPGSPEKSILYQRLKRTDFFRMPPVSVNDEPPPVLPILAEWIRSLNGNPK
ncbi:MAG TPA: PQQ-dependent sugar dehydrogenase, partial [Candidatus Binatia bacterium]|nr:PQQ-dependent sugar dehydrogenase [Candidatus Binatia bacterium]